MQAESNPSADSTHLPDYFPLKNGLVVHARDEGNRHFVIEDTDCGKFYRVGEAEHRFFLALQEVSSASAAYRDCLRDPLWIGMSETKIERFCRWLQVNGMVASDDGHNTNQISGRNPLVAAFFWKVQLLNPDRWLLSLHHRCGWLFSPQAMLISVALFLLGILATTGKWGQFVTSYENLFSSWRWLSIAISWIALKIIHETAHGVTCRRYGGEVKEAGLAMILLMPIAYVNVTSSWRFPSRWQRLHVTMAGVAIELLVAGLALLVWNWVESMPLRQAAADVVLMASVSSILFNLNPLLKFDGYFALADATGIDNLYSFGQSYARYFGGRFLLGLDMQPPRLPESRWSWIKWYGCSAAVYRVFTVAGLLLAASALFHGAGIVIAAAGAISFILRPTLMLLRRLAQLRLNGELSLAKLTLRFTCLVSLVICPLWLIPATGSWTSPAIVQYSPPAVLRVRSPGFIEVVHVHDGQAVKAGTPIVTLRNDELRTQLSRQRKMLAQVEQEILAAQWKRESSALADANARKTALQLQIEESQHDVEGLVIRASVNGCIVSRRLAQRCGTFVDAGEEIAVVGREDSKRLKVSINQADARQVNHWKDKPVRIVFNGRPTWIQKIDRLESRADKRPPDESLLAPNGGPLAAIQHKDRFQLCDARVNGFIELTPERSKQLRCGERASVRFASKTQSLGNYLLVSMLSKLPLDLACTQ